MVIQAENVPSDQKKRVRDGTAGPKRTIRSGKASSRWHGKPGDASNLRKTSLRWHGRPGVCHQFTKSAFEMVRIREHLPSNNKMEIYDGTMNQSFAIK